MPELDGPSALLVKAQTAVQMALDAGAKEVWASMVDSRGIECELRDGELEGMTHDHSRSLSLKIFIEGRYSEHDTSDLRDASIRDFMRDAVALTRAMEPDPYRSLPDPKLYEGRSTVDLEVHDPEVVALSNDDRLATGRVLDARLASQPDVLTRSTRSIDRRYAMARASSNGLAGTEQGTMVGAVAVVTVQDEGDRRPRGSMGLGTCRRADLPSTDWIADEALARGRARVGSRKGPTVTTDLVVDRMAVERLLSMLMGPAHGRSLQQGRSLWAEHEGKPVVSDRLTITDEPLLPRSLGARLFDREGIASRPMKIIEGGALHNFFIDSYYARKLDRAPTTAGWSNLVVEPGEGDAASLAADVGKGIYVTSWLGGNSDSTSGEFSLGLRGHLIEGGKIGAPVDEMNISGNLLQLFSSLRQVGGDPWIHSPMRTPSLVFEGVSFSGA